MAFTQSVQVPGCGMSGCPAKTLIGEIPLASGMFYRQRPFASEFYPTWVVTNEANENFTHTRLSAGTSSADSLTVTAWTAS